VRRGVLVPPTILRDTAAEHEVERYWTPIRG